MRTVYNVHLWLGLLVGIVILTQACSGIVIAFRSKLQHLSYPTETRRSHSLDALVESAAKAVPLERIERLKLDEAGSAIVRLGVTTNSGTSGLVVLDVNTGRILDRGPLWQFPTELALLLHGSLLLGRTGEMIIGLAGLTLVTLAQPG